MQPIKKSIIKVTAMALILAILVSGYGLLLEVPIVSAWRYDRYYNRTNDEMKKNIQGVKVLFSIYRHDDHSNDIPPYLHSMLYSYMPIYLDFEFFNDMLNKAYGSSLEDSILFMVTSNSVMHNILLARYIALKYNESQDSFEKAFQEIYDTNSYRHNLLTMHIFITHSAFIKYYNLDESDYQYLMTFIEKYHLEDYNVYNIYHLEQLVFYWHFRGLLEVKLYPDEEDINLESKDRFEYYKDKIASLRE